MNAGGRRAAAKFHARTGFAVAEHTTSGYGSLAWTSVLSPDADRAGAASRMPRAVSHAPATLTLPPETGRC
jgi:hypothetical protein